jgi:two-component system alkaline phosphatase synthesis response regulator PhoP
MADNERMPLRKEQAANPTLLVVVNDLMFNEFLVSALKMGFDCVVHSVTSGRSALEKVKSVKPDLLIIDYQLPDLKVIELSDRLHGIKELENVPTIIINSYTMYKSEHQGDHTIFLRKPFHLNTLYAAVKQALIATVDCVLVT